MRFPFGKKNHDKQPDRNLAQETHERESAPGTQIHYDNNLVSHFLDHHRVLVDLIGKIKESAEASKFDDAAKYVNKFRMLLNEHLLEENLRLYTYLSYCLKGDIEGTELMRDMRSEMGEIGRKVSRFIKHYTEFGINEENRSKFLKELAQMTAVLGDRIGREERSLYTMYLPPQELQAGR